MNKVILPSMLFAAAVGAVVMAVPTPARASGTYLCSLAYKQCIAHGQSVAICSAEESQCEANSGPAVAGRATRSDYIEALRRK